MRKRRLSEVVKKLDILRLKETICGMDGSPLDTPPSVTKGSGNSECDCNTEANICITGWCPPRI